MFCRLIYPNFDYCEQNNCHICIRTYLAQIYKYVIFTYIYIYTYIIFELHFHDFVQSNRIPYFMEDINHVVCGVFKKYLCSIKDSCDFEILVFSQTGIKNGDQ